MLRSALAHSLPKPPLETVANALWMPALVQCAAECWAAWRQHSSGESVPVYATACMRLSGQDAESTLPPHSMALLRATRHLLLNCESRLLRPERRRYHRAV
jgi:hypothetical protein